jgi:2,4-dienoyl-CoA reductase (NADPH2)
VVERRATVGGVAAIAGPGSELVDWLEAECQRLGVDLATGVAFDAAVENGSAALVLCTGGRPGEPDYESGRGALVADVAGVWSGEVAIPDEGPVAVWDPIGGPIGVAAAERLGARAVLITPDQIAGNELARTGDLAPANVRLQQLGIRIERRAVLRRVLAGEVELEDKVTGERRRLPAVAVVDAGYRLPDATPPPEGQRYLRAGDCVAPRTLLEAVLEGRRAALATDAG